LENSGKYYLNNIKKDKKQWETLLYLRY
jgi:hypothetical protein